MWLKQVFAAGGAALLTFPAAAQPVAPPLPAPAPAASPAPVDPQALAIAREIIRVGFPQEKRLALFSGVADAMVSQMKTVLFARFDNDPAARVIVERALAKYVVTAKSVLAQHIPAFMDAYAQGYAREFSPAELEQILAFVKTPAGAHFVLRGSAIISDPAFAAANQDYIRELQPVIETMRDNLTRELTEYYRQHSPKPSAAS